MWHNLVYDKYAENHHFNNSVTRKISPEDLDDGSFTLYNGREALEVYNKNVSENNIIPEYVIQTDFMRLKVYEKKTILDYDPTNFKIIKNVNVFIVIISINVQLLETYVTNNFPIPELEFVQSLCRFHNTYNSFHKKYINQIINKNILKENINNNNLDSFDELTISDINNYIIKKATTAVNYTFDNQIVNPPQITMKLFEYQKCSIDWMIDKENNLPTISYNVNDEIILGNVYYDLISRNFNLIQNRHKITFYGGGLIDEVGLGKTIQMIALGIKNPSNVVTKVPYLSDVYPDKFYSRATLILCPNQLCGQWIREFQNSVAKGVNLNVISILTKKDYDKYTYQDFLDADFVILSFTFLDNKSFTDPWVTKLGYLKSFYKKNWSSYEVENVKRLFNSEGLELLKNPIKSLSKTNPWFQLIHWHRIAIDEYHEIYSHGDQYLYISNLLPFLKGTYKWIISATPFISVGYEECPGTKCLVAIMNFLTDYKVMYINELVKDENIANYLSSQCFRRNTKKSVEEEHSLPPIEEVLLWMKFSSTERMIYNSYLTNPGNDKFGIFLRQLCCHPQLADETKYSLMNCKTLEDIEKMMVSHYKTETMEEKIKVKKIQKRIRKTVKKIIKVQTKLENKKNKTKNKQESSSSESESSDDEIDDGDIIDETDDINFNLEIFTKNPTLQKLKESYIELNEKLVSAKKIYEGKRASYEFFNNTIERVRKTINKKTVEKEKKELIIPPGLSLIERMTLEHGDLDEDEEENCVVCLCPIPEDDVGVTKCGHINCHTCLKLTVPKNGKCPTCTKELEKNDIYFLSYEKKKKVETKEEKTKNDLINEIGTKLANLIYYLKEKNEHTIIFSQWDDLLRRVGNILTSNGIKNVFCKGNCYQRDCALREFNNNDGVKVIMLSSESAASGTNLTKASQVIFLEPIYGDYEYRKQQERQAVGRANRLGQKNKIKLVRLLIRDTIEEEIYKKNVEEDTKHIEALNISKLDEETIE